MSSHIRAIQTTLKEAGFYTGEIDGIAGKLTVEAVNKAAAKAVVGATEIAIVNDQYETHPENVELTVKEPTSPIKESGFVLGERSLKNLWGVHPDLVAVVKRAIQITRTDFTVIEGVRTKERQRELVRKGASKTMNSRHLTGQAVDIAPVKNGAISWRIDDYYPLAEAMASAADELGVRVRWGGSWSIINNSKNHPSDWIKAYRAGGGKFIDGPHFELPTA